EDVAHLQAARPFLEGVEMTGGIGAANDRAKRRADHDVGDDAVIDQGSHDPDMGKAARCPAAQRKPDHRPANAAEADFVVIGLLGDASGQTFEHSTYLLADQPKSRSRVPSARSVSMVYAVVRQVS